MKFAFSILLFSLMNSQQGFSDRRILVITALEDSSEVNNQIDILQKNSLELKERRLAVFTFIDGELKPILNSSKQSEKFVEKNKANYTATSNPKIYLIGLDKSVKQTFSNFVQPQQIFNIVDSMPMRKAEMRRN